MAPVRTQKRKSTNNASPAGAVLADAAPLESPFRTPTRSPIKKHATGISSKQKQALLDNLQLEITERARKLRAQYMLQAHGLRTRIEMRINRIPTALRKMTMAELLQKYANDARPVSRTARPALTATLPNKRDPESPSPRKPTRKSAEISLNKENEDLQETTKRAHSGPPSRPVSRAKLQPAQVLSPKSSNSRYVPQSSTKPVVNKTLSRPASPVKPVTSTASAAALLSSMVERAKTTRVAGTSKKIPASTVSANGTSRVQRPGTGKRASDVSEASESSTGTTIIRRPASATAKKAPVKKTMMGTIKSIGGGTGPKKVTASRTTTTASGARVLRKRN